jgi:hypothetical protein
MPRPPHATLDWGILETDYTDEFGRVAPDVYAAAGRVWQQAQSYASRVLPGSDTARVRTLLLKSAAQVTRARDRKQGQIVELDAYLFQTFKRAVLAELDKDNNRNRFECEAQLDAELRGQVDNVERRILLDEMVAAMDGWTRDVYEWLTLGYTFDEIARHLGMSYTVLNNKYHRRIESLTKQIKERMTSRE